MVREVMPSGDQRTLTIRVRDEADQTVKAAVAVTVEISA
jgi:hypothetical protein